MMSESTRRSSSAEISFSNSQMFVRSPLASPASCLSVRPIRVPDSRPPSGRVSSLASRVDKLSLMETCGSCQPPPITVSPGLITMDDTALPKSFNDLCHSPALNMESETPWYRYCRPTAPVPLISDSVEVGSPSVLSASVEDVQRNSHDQENLSSLPPTVSPAFVQPLAAVSNILQSLVMFGERLPKWSVLHRSESIPIPPRSSSSSSAELLNQASFRSANDMEHNLNATSPSGSPQTPPLSLFDRRRSWFTSRVAPGVARPTVLKRGPASSFDLVISRTTDLHSLKRSATNSCNTSEELSVKKSRVHSLVPSERSAFLPVSHHRKSLIYSTSSSFSEDPMNQAMPLLPSSSI